MNIEITEEEREFLERILTRAELFTTMKVFRDNILKNDIGKIRVLKDKFKVKND